MTALIVLYVILGVLIYRSVLALWRPRIRRWCREHRFQLLACRFVWPWEVGYPYYRLYHTFRIVVCDEHGTTRSGRLEIYPFWAGSEPQVTWDQTGAPIADTASPSERPPT